MAILIIMAVTLRNKSKWNPSDAACVARNNLTHEVRQGRMVRASSCELCGSGRGVMVGHHWKGYGYALNVWWICVTCNQLIDVHDGSLTKEDARRLVSRSPSSAKTDNTNLQVKLALRRHFLDKYHAEGWASVLDCCQGDGVIWDSLRAEYEIASYWGVDKKTKKGRLRIDSTRILAQPGWKQNVIDVDTYGSPWDHWEAMIQNIQHPTTVFLTIGVRATGTIGRMSRQAMTYLGLGSLYDTMPPAFHSKMSKHAGNYCFARASDFGLEIKEIVEAFPSKNARYVGLRIVRSEQVK